MEEAAMQDRPTVIVFDVNETLSDTAGLAGSFTEVGAPGHLVADVVGRVAPGRVRADLDADNVAFGTIAAPCWRRRWTVSS